MGKDCPGTVKPAVGSVDRGMVKQRRRNLELCELSVVVLRAEGVVRVRSHNLYFGAFPARLRGAGPRREV